MVTDDFGQLVATPSTTLREQIDAGAARMTPHQTPDIIALLTLNPRRAK